MTVGVMQPAFLHFDVANSLELPVTSRHRPFLYIYTKKFVIFYPFAEKPPMYGIARNFAQGVAWRT